jgi:hypothetical protein
MEQNKKDTSETYIYPPPKIKLNLWDRIKSPLDICVKIKKTWRF